MHPARALARLRQAGLDRDMQFGRSTTLAHLEDMDLALAIGAGIVAHQAHVHDLGQHGLGRGQFGNRDGDRPQPANLVFGGHVAAIPGLARRGGGGDQAQALTSGSSTSRVGRPSSVVILPARPDRRSAQ